MEVDVAIVGAGIAGLYAGFRLARMGKPLGTFAIFEASEHVGGRIWTDRTFDPEFALEFGPMRIELDVQPLLRNLLVDLDFNLQDDLVPFPPPTSPEVKNPTYDLEDEEKQNASPIELLALALRRVFSRVRAVDPQEYPWNGAGYCWSENDLSNIKALNAKLDTLACDLRRLPDNGESAGWKKIFARWISMLDEDDYQDIREYGVYRVSRDEPGGTPLWQEGFWNLLSDVLSHSAVLKMRDHGNFYHLLAENPNAAQWSTFWLRYLKVKDNLVGIRGGMQRITDVLRGRLSDHIFVRHKVLGISRGPDGIALTFESPGSTTSCLVRKHLILALPKGPMISLVARNPQSFPNDIMETLDSVTALPLLKLFVIVAKKWWQADDVVLTNRYAQNFPTRECHTLKSNVQKSTRGAVLIYTEPPASNFWTNYILNRDRQDSPERGTVSENPRLVFKLLKYLRDIYRRDVKPVEISYAIRDWGRAPYHGAVHIWRPMRRSSEILRSLSALAPPPGVSATGPVTHVCGEAYSDYNGFIEGSLRSTMHVLHLIDKEFETPTPWLCDAARCRHGDRQSPRPSRSAALLDMATPRKARAVALRCAAAVGDREVAKRPTRKRLIARGH